MTTDVLLAAIVSNLEEQIAVHREREAFHAQTEPATERRRHSKWTAAE